MKTVRWIMALVLMIAAGAKLFGAPPAQTMYGSLPPWMQIALLVFEIFIAGWLASGLFSRPAALLMLMLLSAFIGAIYLEMRKEHPQPCGCLGEVAASSSDPAIIRRNLGVSLASDLALAAGASWIFLASKRSTRALATPVPV